MAEIIESRLFYVSRLRNFFLERYTRRLNCRLSLPMILADKSWIDHGINFFSVAGSGQQEFRIQESGIHSLVNIIVT